MKRMPAIKTVMSPFPHSVDTEATVAEARDFMHAHGIRHLPVTRNGELAGMVSERDIRLMLGGAGSRDMAAVRIGDLMVSDAYTVDLETRLDEVLDHMAERHLGSVLVTRKGRLAGVFTLTDACNSFAGFLRDQVRRAGGDDAA